MKWAARQAAIMFATFGLATAVQIAVAAQPLLNLETTGVAPRQPTGSVYAPAEPPAASVPGTLYVPKGFERGLNESDEAFVARMKVKQAAAVQAQSALLQEHSAAMMRITQMTSGRPRTEQDDLAGAAWQRAVQQEQTDAKVLRARRTGRSQGATD